MLSVNVIRAICDVHARTLESLRLYSNDDDNHLDPTVVDELLATLPVCRELRRVDVTFRLPPNARRVLESEIEACLPRTVERRKNIRLAYENRRKPTYVDKFYYEFFN
jgi:hypothetical protein